MPVGKRGRGQNYRHFYCIPREFEIGIKGEDPGSATRFIYTPVSHPYSVYMQCTNRQELCFHQLQIPIQYIALIRRRRSLPNTACMRPYSSKQIICVQIICVQLICMKQCKETVGNAIYGLHTSKYESNHFVENRDMEPTPLAMLLQYIRPCSVSIVHTVTSHSRSAVFFSNCLYLQTARRNNQSIFLIPLIAWSLSSWLFAASSLASSSSASSRLWSLSRLSEVSSNS